LPISWQNACRGRPLSAGSSLLRDGQLARPFAALLARPHSSSACAQPQLPPAGKGISDPGRNDVRTRVASARRQAERRQLKQLPLPPRPLDPDPDPAFQLEQISGTDGDLNRRRGFVHWLGIAPITEEHALPITTHAGQAC
jgi:hypothetical protein